MDSSESGGPDVVADLHRRVVAIAVENGVVSGGRNAETLHRFPTATHGRALLLLGQRRAEKRVRPILIVSGYSRSIPHELPVDRGETAAFEPIRQSLFPVQQSKVRVFDLH